MHHFSHLTTLEELWLSSNSISSFSSLESLTPLTSLTCVYLEHNPIARDAGYRGKVLGCLPKLSQIDSYDASAAVGGGAAGLGGSGPSAIGGRYGMASMTDEQRAEVMNNLRNMAIERARKQKIGA